MIALQIALLGKPGGVFAETARDWEQFVTVIGHPLVWLFFGGFILAAGMARTGLDRRLAAALLGRLGDSPSAVLLGVMGITFSLSMFMSNTATTAMILAMLAPLLATLPEPLPAREKEKVVPFSVFAGDWLRREVLLRPPDKNRWSECHGSGDHPGWFGCAVRTAMSASPRESSNSRKSDSRRTSSPW